MGYTVLVFACLMAIGLSGWLKDRTSDYRWEIVWLASVIVGLVVGTLAMGHFLSAAMHSTFYGMGTSICWVGALILARVIHKMRTS